jgi:hypothetical protein
MIARGLIAGGLAAAALLAAQAAWAQEELKNDGFADGGTAGFQSGFVAGEMGAARFAPSLPGAKLLSVQIVFGGGAEGVKKDIFLHVWKDDALGTGPGAEMYKAGYTVTAAQMALQELDVSAGNVVVSGPFRVGVEFQHDGLPSIARDDDGTIAADKNFIFAQGIGWKPSDQLGITGDWIIRAIVEGGGGTGGTGGSGGGTGSGGATTGSGGAGGMPGSGGSGGMPSTGGSGGSGGSTGAIECIESSDCAAGKTCEESKCVGGAAGGCGCRAAGSDPPRGWAWLGGLVAALSASARLRRRGARASTQGGTRASEGGGLAGAKRPASGRR